MRDFKFRVFDTSGDLAYFKLDGQILRDGIQKQPLKSILEQEENFWLMQFTDFKDEKDKEIYEGDVVRLIEFEDRGDGSFDDFFAKVVWDEGSFIIKNGNYEEFLYELHHLCQVVGNVFENLDLLR